MKLTSLLPLALACAPLQAAAVCSPDGLALFLQEDYKASAKAFERAVQTHPRDADCHVWLGRALGRRAERMSGLAKLGAMSVAGDVRESFERAVEIDPANLEALQSLFAFYAEAPGIVGGGVDKAEPLVSRIAALDRAAGLRAQADLHRRAGRFEQAEAALRQAVEIDPDDIGHHLSLASFLARQERFKESDAIYDALLAAHPRDPAVWFSFGKELARAGRRTAQARKLLNQYLSTPLPRPDAEPYSEARKLLEEL